MLLWCCLLVGAAALVAFDLVYCDWLLFAVRFFGSVRVSGVDEFERGRGVELVEE